MPPRLCGRGRNTGLTLPPPPFHAFGEAVSQLRASGAAGTLFSSLLCLMVASPWACPA